MKKYDGVLQRVRILEEKRGIKYANTDGKLYHTLRFFCVAFAIWAMCTNLLFILGHLLTYSGTEQMSQVSGKIITVAVCSVVIIACPFFNKFKLYIISAILNVLSTVFLSLQFANMLTDDFGFMGYKTSFYFRHFIPLALMSLLFIWMTAIAVRARIKSDRMYKKVTENLYETYRVNVADGEELSDEKWDEFLKDYNPYEKSKLVVDEEEAENEG